MREKEDRVATNRYFLEHYLNITILFMWAWDYTPSSSGRMKPVTKAQLRKMQQDFARADEISKEVLKQEESEKEKVSLEVDGLLTDAF